MTNGSAADPGDGSPLYGTYQLSFNGKVTSIHGLSMAVGKPVYDAATNTTTATVQILRQNQGSKALDNNMLAFFGTQRTADSPVNSGITNVRLIRPQYAPNGQKWWDSPDQTFTNPFLDSLKPFTTLRFMVWTATNENYTSDWDQRTPPDWSGPHVAVVDGKRVSTGQSWESAIEMANTLHKDLWINVPTRASDDYVRQLATLLQAKVDPDLHIYVEYSNETWNYGFNAWSYLHAYVTQLPTADPESAQHYAQYCSPGSGSQEVCRTAERLKQISDIFGSVWGEAAINARIRPVLCSQLVGAVHMWDALSFIKTVYGGEPSKYFYGLCSAPYWGGTMAAGQTLDDVLADSDASIPSWDGYLLQWTAAARYYGLRNFVYEGGEGLTDPKDANTATMLAASADPRMGAQVTRALTGAFANGVDMYMYFLSSSGWSKWGAWGATNDILDLATPKYAALVALQGKEIARSLDVDGTDSATGLRRDPTTMLPGTIDASRPLFTVVRDAVRPLYSGAIGVSAAADGVPGYVAVSDKLGPGSGAGYLVTAPQAGSYTVQLNLDTSSATPASTVQIYVNRQQQGNGIAVAAAPRGAAVQPEPLTVDLPTGVSTIVLAANGNARVTSINVSR
ncbi:MAG TPA: hypothetical protein VF265_08910 [Nevskiaceae bacterium]